MTVRQAVEEIHRQLCRSFEDVVVHGAMLHPTRPADAARGPVHTTGGISSGGLLTR